MSNLRAVWILAAVLVLAGFLNGGIYQVVAAGVVAAGAGSGGSNDVSGDTEVWGYRLNRFSGEVVAIYRGRAMFGVPLVEPKAPAATPSR